MTSPQTGRNPSFSERKPVLIVIIIELLLLLAVFAAGAVATVKQLDYTSPVLMSFTPMAVVLIIYLTVRRKWGETGFRSLRTIPVLHVKYYIPLLLVLGTIALKGFTELTLTKVIFFVFFTLLVAFVEETVYRGLIFKTLLRRSAMAAVVTSSILFSVTHMLNALSGQSVADTMLQLVYALLLGAVLALLMLKNGNIIPLILFHFIHNLIQFLSDDLQDANTLPYDLFLLVVLVFYCIWLTFSVRTTKRSSSDPGTTGHKVIH
ncbi:CPBP family intramembrane glutamic endopeptidase [Paenibacillus xylanilyticus]|uniref:CPBP family intramembrane metalloprotease n=1 Tax=Paenibacillus xylanilyticus TaxID=248903 RepID=A0A7Y6EUD2_9BACL|nr:CPBP family intramembrane glutamic endopeptidase [Paenibacillus xylanilyticus]NUU74574.1 CPBP family intramembrane metalloprotease [Paenibacillus xylanilyticus]